MDSIAAFGIAHIERLADGTRYRHAMQLIPPEELAYHQDEHCLCGPMVEQLPLKANGARWLVRHYRLLDHEEAQPEDA
jgi:hypothetical protein